MIRGTTTTTSSSSLLLGLLVAVIALWTCGAQAADNAARAQSYDYVVVGGGTAGLAVAVRLSQGLPQAKILVVEAGPVVSGDLGIDVPGLKGSTLGGPYDWGFLTVPQAGVKDRVSFWSRGKIVGGSSALNFLVYDRGSEIEYAWDQLGSAGWNWSVIYPAMQKSVNFTGPNTGSGLTTAATGGPVHATVPRIVPDQQQPFIPTVASLGIPTNQHCQDGDPIGVAFQPSTIDATYYNRSWAANSYLPLAGSGLTVLANTRVARINLEAGPSTLAQYQATGITLQDGTVITATHEVILAAGSIQSPGLLELSGIGAPSHTSTSTRGQLVSLPGVGENLQDHLRVQTAYQLRPNYTSFDKLTYNTTFAAEQLALWTRGASSLYDYNGSGFIFSDWARAIGNTTAGKLRSLARQAAAAAGGGGVGDQARLSWLNNTAVAQLEVFFADGYTGSKGYPPQGSPLYSQGFSTLLGVLLHPFARGSVHVNTSTPDPLVAPPIIDPGYLDNPYDVQGLVEIAKFLRRIARTAPFSAAFVDEYEPGYGAIPLLGSSSDDDEDDALWQDYVLNVTDTLWHPCGTCAMLPRGQGGVVDGNLRVYGTAGLRIVDASVIPLLVGAHMQSLVYGIAERAAELIIADHAATTANLPRRRVKGRWPWEGPVRL